MIGLIGVIALMGRMGRAWGSMENLREHDRARMVGELGNFWQLGKLA